MSIETNKTYKIRSAISSTRMLNLYSSGTAANGMNVVLYTSDDSNEQKWLFDGDRLRPKTDITFCLDRYTASTYLNNADIWKASAKDAAAQKIKLEAHGIYYYILLQTKVGGKDYCLTASNNTNGNATATGKQAGADGNVYWAEQLNGGGDYHQLWFFTEDSGSSSGGETGGSGDTYTINGKTIPMANWPVGSYWTTDGTPNGTSLSHNNSYECAGFARYVYSYLWGNDYYGSSVSKATLSGTSSDFEGISVGARINCDKNVTESESQDTSTNKNHSMVLVDKTNTGVVVYHANWALPKEHQYCIVKTTHWTYAEFAKKFKNIKSTSYTP